MIDDPAFVPILTPPSWPGRSECLNRPLCPIEDLRQPLVAFGLNGREALVYLRRSEAEATGLSLARIEAIALKHLVSRQGRAPWKREIVAEGSRKRTFLVREGDDLTAADVLSPKDLEAAHAYFKSDDLYVGLPNRRSMIACTEPLEMVPLIEELHSNAVGEGGPALSSLVFHVSKGRVAGLVTRPGEAEPPPAPASVLPTEEDAPPRPGARVVRRNGVGSFILPLQCDSLRDLMGAMAWSLDALTPKFATARGFEGPVVFQIRGKAPFLDRAGRAAVDDFLERANAVARKARLKGPNGKCVSFELETP